MQKKINYRQRDECPFCNLDPTREIISESTLTFAIYDKYPVNTGHTLIIPRRHCSSYFELTDEEQISCWQMVNELKTVLTKKYNPDGFNIGININQAAGQTIPHVHIHLIPRFKGDIPEPEGGVRGVIPEKRMYRFNIDQKEEIIHVCFLQTTMRKQI